MSEKDKFKCGDVHAHFLNQEIPRFSILMNDSKGNLKLFWLTGSHLNETYLEWPLEKLLDPMATKFLFNLSPERIYEVALEKFNEQRKP